MGELCTIISSISIDWNYLMQEVKADSSLSHIRMEIKAGGNAPFGFSLNHGWLFYKGQFVLAKASPFIPVLLQEYHDSSLGGHGGEVKTYQRLVTEWYWDGMRK